MTSVAHVTAMYATKRRRRNSKNVRTVCSKDSHSKSNPSKRHRERLNQELDTLASLLPFEQCVLSKLDKLSILRLSVSYLRTKSYFQAALLNSGRLSTSRTQQQLYQHQFHAGSQQLDSSTCSTPSQQLYSNELPVKGDLIVEALNGFLLILTCDGEVFYTSHTVEEHLGFHPSDICHQSVYELVHSEDREELMQQLKWSSLIPQQQQGASLTNGTGSHEPQVGAVAGNGEQTAAKQAAQMSIQEVLNSPDHQHLLERNFTARFRCLKDNTSGFLRLDIRGRIKVLHGQQNQQNLANSASASKKHHHHQQTQQQPHFASDGSPLNQREPMLAFFGICIPFGPASPLELPSKDSVFKSKHRLDMSIISMDSRGKQLLGLNDLSTIFKQSTASVSGCSSPSGNNVCSLGNKLQQATSNTQQIKLESNNNNKSGSCSTNATKQQQNVSVYDLVHHDDLSYMASAHQELLKTGASGLIAYRMIVQNESKNQWLQTSAKLYYKNSKPDFILCTHRPLMEEEGRDLLGKRTMDFKVTYLDVGLSSINDRIMACDKFSSLQALGQSSSISRSKSPSNGTAINSAINSVNHLASSPALSGESSRSLASLSPKSNLNEENQVRIKSSLVSKRKSNNDLNLNHQNQQYLDDYDTQELLVGQQQQQQQQLSFNSSTSSTASNLYDSIHYKAAQNGDVFYDMDTSITSANEPLRKSSHGAKQRKASNQNGNTNKKASKKRDLHLSEAHLPGDLMNCANDAAISKSSKKMHKELNEPLQQQHSSMDQQLHIYNHHYNQHHHETSADTYPAIQAAAVYAASLGHPHSGGVAHQGYATSAAYPHHHHHTANHSAASQSLYGPNSMVSPSGAYSQHHSQLHHHLDPTSYQPAHYGAFVANSPAAAYQAANPGASASSFLPTEHLLHHYSQSAARSAALAVWPTQSQSSSSTSATQSSAATDYAHHNNHQTGSYNGSNTSSGSSWNASAAAAAAAALVASANGADLAKRDLESYSPNSHHDQYQQQANNEQQYQHYQQPANSASDSSSPNNKSSSSLSASVAQRYTSLANQQLQKNHAPASLNSDGSARRSPLSSGESSNGSLATAQAVAAATAMANASADSAISSGYYLAEPHQQQQANQQQQGQQQHTHTHNLNQHQHQHQQSYAQHTQQLAAYHHHHQNAYAAQYGDVTHFNQHHFGHQHHLHHQQAAGSEQHAAAYFQAAAGNDLSSTNHHSNVAHSAASSAMAAVKLYGANGESSSQQHISLEQQYPSYTNLNSSLHESLKDETLCLKDKLENSLTNSNTHLQSLSNYANHSKSIEWSQLDLDSSKQLDSSGSTHSNPDSPEEDCDHPNQYLSHLELEPTTADSRTHRAGQDSLARLISSTIGDITLDIAKPQD